MENRRKRYLIIAFSFLIGGPIIGMGLNILLQLDSITLSVLVFIIPVAILLTIGFIIYGKAQYICKYCGGQLKTINQISHNRFESNIKEDNNQNDLDLMNYHSGFPKVTSLNKKSTPSLFNVSVCDICGHQENIRVK